MTWTVKMADARYDGYEEGFDEGREAGLQVGIQQGIIQAETADVGFFTTGNFSWRNRYFVDATLRTTPGRLLWGGGICDLDDEEVINIKKLFGEHEDKCNGHKVLEDMSECLLQGGM